MKYELRGVFTSTNFCHQTAFDESAGGNVTKQSMLRLALNKTTDDGRNFLARVPFITGNSLRGRLRRSIIDLVEEQLEAKENQIETQTYRSLRSGSAGIAGMSKKELPVARFLASAKHPIYGLMGFETLLASQLVTPDIVPITEDTVAAQRVPADLIPEEEVHSSTVSLLQTVTSTRRDDFALLSDPAAANVVRDFEKSHDSLQTLIFEERKARKAKKSGDVDTGEAKKYSDLTNIMSLEAIVPGTRFWWRLGLGPDPRTTRYVLPAHVGLVLLGLERIIGGSVLGGIARLGYGTVNGTFDLCENGEAIGPALTTRGGATMIHRENGTVRECVEAAEIELEGLTGESLDSMSEPV